MERYLTCRGSQEHFCRKKERTQFIFLRLKCAIFCSQNLSEWDVILINCPKGKLWNLTSRRWRNYGSIN